MFVIERNSMTVGIRLLLLATLLGSASSMASAQDAFGYTATSAVPFSYRNIAGAGVAVLAGTDDGTATIAIPFPFRFYGTSYTSVCVSTNGLMAFGGCPANDFTNLDLTSQSPQPDLPLMAPFWMDLSFAVPGSGTIVYQTLGSAGSRQFIIQWNNVYALNSPGPLNFQVVLSETSNMILFQYQNVESGSASVSKGAGATIGIRGASGQSNNYRLQWSYRAPVLSNNMAIRFAPPVSAAAVDVSSSIRATTSAFVYNRLTQIFSGTVNITNTGTAPLNRPLTIVLTNLSAGVTAVNATGTAPGQGPYYAVPGTAALNPGQAASVSVQFRNPSNIRINFVVKTYSGNF